jgi:diacylglycerol kinase family enzyme
MRILLVHNPKAGDGDRARLRALLETIRSAGHEVRYRSSRSRGLAAFLAQPADRVAVAGGDGTLAKVARLMLGRRTPIAPLAMGTANNIATSLGHDDASPEEQVEAWASDVRLRFDVGLARGPWGERRVFESFGLGAVPEMMTLMQDADTGSDTGAEIARATRMLRKLLRRVDPLELEIRLDDRDLSGRYLIVEAMNIPLAGPNLPLAPHADPTDRRLDLVLVHESERDLAREFLQDARKRRAPTVELPTLRGTRLRMRGRSFFWHADDRIDRFKSGSPNAAGAIDVVLRDSVHFAAAPDCPYVAPPSAMARPRPQPRMRR